MSLGLGEYWLILLEDLRLNVGILVMMALGLEFVDMPWEFELFC